MFPAFPEPAASPVSAARAIRWTEADTVRSARWHSENGAPPPRRVIPADDAVSADTALRLARAGVGVLWRGDYPNGRRLLQAMRRRLVREATRNHRGDAPRHGIDPAEAFRRHRRARSRQARVLGRLLVVLDERHRLDLRRAPDVEQACTQAYGAPTVATAVAFTELLGVIGAYEWRRKGVDVPALCGRIHPHYGVFSPVRGDYVDLVARAPLPAAAVGPDGRAFDVGTGTGVLAAVLVRRGIGHLVATDINPRALACAADNLRRLRPAAARIEVVGPALFPRGRAHLVVCNPPWLPGRPASAVEHGVYDADSGMLTSFLSGLRHHLEPEGEGWLILSDLAERLGLRRQGEFLGCVRAAGLRVVGRLDADPRVPRGGDTADPVHRARVEEVVSLWRLVPA